MTTAILVLRVLGLSHLAQPPLSAWLARRFALRQVFAGLPSLPRNIATNMGVASIALPTCCGCLIAVFAEEVLRGGGMFALAWEMALFWSWRLWRQAALANLLPRTVHVVLCSIFVVQGPGLVLFLGWWICSAWSR